MKEYKIYINIYDYFETVTKWRLMIMMKKQTTCMSYIDGLMQGRRNSIANALELRLSYSNPSILLTEYYFCWCSYIPKIHDIIRNGTDFAQKFSMRMINVYICNHSK